MHTQRIWRAINILAACALAAWLIIGPGSAHAGEKLCDVSAFGAKGNGLTKDTGAIQKAVEACAAAGGGTVVLRGGTFLSGTITLASHIVLRIEAGATLLGSRDAADYPTLNPPTVNTQLEACQRALVYAQGANHVRIEGGGTIDGNADNAQWRGMALPEGARPMAIFTALSSDVAIEGVTVRNAATWAVVNLEVAQLLVRGITVDSPLGPTHDGIDVVDGHDVRIENNTITSGDDAICLKSGSPKGLQDVTVRNNRILGAGVANGLKIGTASVGPIRNIVFEDISIANAQAAAMAVESVDGSAISNMAFRRITATRVGTPFFVMLGARGKARVGSISGLSFEAIRASDMRYPWGALISGAPADAFGAHDLGPISFKDLDLRFKGSQGASGPYVYASTAVDVDRFPHYQGGYPDPKFIFATPSHKSEVTDYALPGWAFFIRHAEGVAFADCKLTVDGEDNRAAIVAKQARVSGSCTP
jgi:hypothetical protein